MKLFLLLLISLSIYCQDTFIGLSETQVVMAMGDPAGKLTNGNVVIWVYPKGTIKFEYGVVVETNLISDEALEKKLKKRKEEPKRIKMSQGSKNYKLDEIKSLEDRCLELHQIADRYQKGELTEKQYKEIRECRDKAFKLQQEVNNAIIS